MTDPSPPLSTEIDASPLSQDLKTIAAAARQADHLTLQDILDLFGQEGFILLQVFLAVMNIVLSPLPGQSTVLGAVMVLIAWAMLRGHPRAVLPARLGQYRIASHYIVTGLEKIRAVHVRSGRLLRPRSGLISKRMVNWAIMIMALVILAPIPFGNTIAAIAIILLGIGQSERDSIWIWCGMVIAALHIILPAWGIEYLVTHSQF